MNTQNTTTAGARTREKGNGIIGNRLLVYRIIAMGGKAVELKAYAILDQHRDINNNCEYGDIFDGKEAQLSDWKINMPNGEDK